MDGSRPRWFGVGLKSHSLLSSLYVLPGCLPPHPHPSFLSSFPCPSPFPHFSGFISAPPPTSPTNSPSLFPPASPAPDSSSCWCKCFNEAVSSVALPGEVIERPESRVSAPCAGAWSGCQGGRGSWEQGSGPGMGVSARAATRGCG